jgi:hypothetical protein
MELINMLMLDAGPNEIGVTDKEWMDMIDEIYQMYRDISGVPKIGFSLTQAPSGRGTSLISDELRIQFARAMLSSIGKDPLNQKVRDHVRSKFKKEGKDSPYYIDVDSILPVEMWEKYPDVDFNAAKEKFEESHLYIEDAKQLARESISDPTYKTYASKVSISGEYDVEIEEMLDDYFTSLSLQKKPKQVPGVGEQPQAPAPGGYYNPNDLFSSTEWHHDVDLSDTLVDDFKENASSYNEGKVKQADYFYANNPAYNLMGNTAKGIFKNRENRLRYQYDLEKELGSYKNPYINYIEDYMKGTVKPWSNEQWGVAMQNITGTANLNTWTTPDEKIQQASEKSIEGGWTTEQTRDYLKLSNALIHNEDTVKNWILNKELAGIDPTVRAYRQPALIKELDNFIMQNMGAEKEQTLNPMTRDLAGTASQNIGRKLFKEWQDRSWNWSTGKSKTIHDEEERLKKQGYKLETTGGT